MPVRRIPVAVVLVLSGCVLVGCSSSGSGGGGPPAPTASSTAAAVDRPAVLAALNQVLTGLRSTTSVPKGATVGQAAAAIGQASTDFSAAAQALSPPPTGVPDGVATPVATRLLQLGGLFHQAADCLQHQAHAKPPQTAPCLPPLRRANAKDGELAHELISLAVYSTQSPKTFEAQLVKALR